MHSNEENVLFLTLHAQRMGMRIRIPYSQKATGSYCHVSSHGGSVHDFTELLEKFELNKQLKKYFFRNEFSTL